MSRRSKQRSGLWPECEGVMLGPEARAGSDLADGGVGKKLRRAIPHRWLVMVHLRGYSHNVFSSAGALLFSL